MSGCQLRQVINLEHVESMKVTSDTTVYVRFTSGESTLFEFQNSEKLEDMLTAYIAWCNGIYKRKSFTVYQEEK